VAVDDVSASGTICLLAGGGGTEYAFRSGDIASAQLGGGAIVEEVDSIWAIIVDLMSVKILIQIVLKKSTIKFLYTSIEIHIYVTSMK
jgi:hypothetical protein